MTDRMRTACTPKLCTTYWKMVMLNQHGVINDYLLCTIGNREGKKTLIAHINFMATFYG